MKKLLLILVAVFAIGGATFAQDYYYDFDYHAFMSNAGITSFVQIEGVYVEESDPYDQIEVAAFVLVNGVEECRGRQFMSSYVEWGDPYPLFEMQVYYTLNNGEGVGDQIIFKMHNHATGQNYVGTPSIEMVTGEWYGDEIIMGEYDDAPYVNFVPVAEFEMTKDIIGWNSGEEGMHFYLLSSPVENATPEAIGMYANAYDLYYFNQTGIDGKEWINQKSNTADEDFLTLAFGKGYLYASAETTQLTFTGTPNTESAVDLVYNADAGWAGVNLIGNPLPQEATIDRDEFYRMDVTGTVLMANDPDEEPVVDAMEGIIVVATGDGEYVTFTPTGGGRVANKAGKLAINLDNGRSVIDRAILRFEENHMLPKLQLNENSTKIYFTQNDKDYAVVNVEEQGEMPFSFSAEKNGHYTLSFNFSNVEFGYLHLIDNMTGIETDLLNTPSYSFEAKTTDYASRFKLVFATGNGSEDNFAFFSNGNWVINNDGEATLQVVDVTGRILKSESINGCANVNVNAAPGVYMIRLVNGDNVKVQKVVVR